MLCAKSLQNFLVFGRISVEKSDRVPGRERQKHISNLILKSDELYKARRMTCWGWTPWAGGVDLG